MKFTRKTFAEQPYLYVERECDYDGAKIAEAMGSALTEILSFVGEKHITPLSAPMSIYMSMSPDKLRFRGAVKVTAKDAARAEGTVKSGSLPLGDAMATVHTGPYSHLNVTHQALWKHMEDNAIPAAFPVWEIYIDDPGKVAEDKLRTEIYRKIG